MAADIRRDDGVPRFQWRIWDPIDASVSVYRQVMTKSIAEKIRWKSQYELAKQHTWPGDTPTANGPPAAARNQAVTHSASSSRQPAAPGRRAGCQG